MSLERTTPIALVALIERITNSCKVATQRQLRGTVVAYPEGKGVLIGSPSEESGYWRRLESTFGRSEAVRVVTLATALLQSRRWELLMFDRFSTEAKEAVNLGRQCALENKTGWFEPVHLLVGICRTRDSNGNRVLAACGANAKEIADRAVGRAAQLAGRAKFEAAHPFTAQTKLVLKCGVEEAITLGHSWLGTHHLLVGIIRVDADLAQELEARGVGLDRARNAMAEVHREVASVDRAQAPSKITAAKELSPWWRQVSALSEAMIVCTELNELDIAARLRQLVHRLQQSGDTEAD